MPLWVDYHRKDHYIAGLFFSFIKISFKMSLRETSEVKTVLIIYLISFLLSLKIRKVESTMKKVKKKETLRNRSKNL